MRRRGLACLTVAVAVTGFTACDTNDGREMEPPSSYARFQLQSTAPSTAPTTVPPPTEITVPSTSTTTAPSTTTEADSASSAPGSESPGTDDETAASAPAGDAAADASAFPDLALQGLELTGPWEPGGAIDASFTCDGAGDAPLITWTAPPTGTVELAFAAIDESAGGFVHWLVIGLPAEAGSLGGGAPVAVGSAAINSFDSPGWGGPCPPPGGGPHTYRFTIYALGQAIGLTAESPAVDLLSAIEGVTIGVANFTGTYERA